MVDEQSHLVPILYTQPLVHVLHITFSLTSMVKGHRPSTAHDFPLIIIVPFYQGHTPRSEGVLWYAANIDPTLCTVLPPGDMLQFTCT